MAFEQKRLNLTSPTFSFAMSNILPAITFVMAVLSRMEKVNIKKVRCQAKVVGIIVTVAGAMLMTLYKGPIVEMVWSKYVHPRQSYVTNTIATSDKDWFKGSIFLSFYMLNFYMLSDSNQQFSRFLSYLRALLLLTNLFFRIGFICCVVE